jgi:hypothetical protein
VIHDIHSPLDSSHIKIKVALVLITHLLQYLIGFSIAEDPLILGKGLEEYIYLLTFIYCFLKLVHFALESLSTEDLSGVMDYSHWEFSLEEERSVKKLVILNHHYLGLHDSILEWAAFEVQSQVFHVF